MKTEKEDGFAIYNEARKSHGARAIIKGLRIKVIIYIKIYMKTGRKMLSVKINQQL